MSKLGNTTKTDRGFSIIEFNDVNDNKCTLQCSSAIGYYDDSFDRPGSSFLWLGISDPNHLVLASQAPDLGIQTKETTGWVEYPIPKGVMVDSRMHLDREQVKQLVSNLTDWLNNGSFT